MGLYMGYTQAIWATHTYTLKENKTRHAIYERKKSRCIHKEENHQVKLARAMKQRKKLARATVTDSHCPTAYSIVSSTMDILAPPKTMFN
jgi:hypothetical protein